MPSLLSKLKETYRDLGIPGSEIASIKVYIPLLMQHTPTYEHSVRVALKSVEVAKFLRIDPKSIFKAALFHDIGKYSMGKDILNKTTDYTEEDHEKMKRHPDYGYRILRNIHPFSAEVLLRHHKFSKTPYPTEMLKPRIPFSEEIMKLIEECAKIVSLVDFYDALMTRKDGKYGTDISDERAKSILIENYSDQKNLILDLYKEGIF